MSADSVKPKTRRPLTWSPGRQRDPDDWATVDDDPWEDAPPTRPEPKVMKVKAGARAPLQLSTGDKVRHAKFGEGIVMNAKPSGEDVEVTVVFDDGGGVKRLLLGFAPLEKVS